MLARGTLNQYTHVRMARPPRLERGTLCLEGRCSIQLSYGRSRLVKLIYLRWNVSGTLFYPAAPLLIIEPVFSRQLTVKAEGISGYRFARSSRRNRAVKSHRIQRRVGVGK